MQYNFCTLFDKNYLSRGLALHRSIAKHCPKFCLWILCMDDIAYKLLRKMSLKNVVLIHLADFEDDKLREIKKNRTMAEYCWSLSPILPLYIFNKKPDVDSICYLDSDIYFFSSPKPIYKEMGEGSILLIKHNYEKQMSYIENRAGIYNVTMVIFRNDRNAREALEWWKDRCMEWCYNRYENGKFGDQMYLNDWTERFKGVHILKHKGADVAPWNLNRYQLSKKRNRIFIDDYELIFYHFHSLKIHDRDKYHLCSYTYNIKKNAREWIYKPYVDDLKSVYDFIFKHDLLYFHGFSKELSVIEKGAQVFKRYFRRLLRI